MRIDRALNLVVPVETDAGMIYVHSAPISREVFEEYCLPLAKTFAAIYQEGLSVVAGPRVAAMLLKKITLAMPGSEPGSNAWDGLRGVERGLLGEVRRLTNVVMPAEHGGWETIPFADAVPRKLLSADDLSEVENAIVFFTCASVVPPRAQRALHLNGMAEIWGAQISSLNSTEYAASLPISTGTGSSGVPAA